VREKAQSWRMFWYKKQTNRIAYTRTSLSNYYCQKLKKYPLLFQKEKVCRKNH
jgi:hypothetical protein